MRAGRGVGVSILVNMNCLCFKVRPQAGAASRRFGMNCTEYLYHLSAMVL